MTVVGLTIPNDRQHHAKEPERSADRLPQGERSEAISALPALEGAAEAEAQRVERRRFPLSHSLQTRSLQPKSQP